MRAARCRISRREIYYVLLLLSIAVEKHETFRTGSQATSMSSSAKSLSSLLLQQSSIDDHEEILKACNTALKTSKNDPELLHVRFVALLKLDRYEDALKAIEESGDKLKDRAKIERAYALYKNGQLEEAKALAQTVTQSRGAKHVEAQAVGCFTGLL